MIVVSLGHTWDYRPKSGDWLSRKQYATKEAAEQEAARMPWYTLAEVIPIIDGYWHIRAGGSVDPLTEREGEIPFSPVGLRVSHRGREEMQRQFQSRHYRLLQRLLVQFEQLPTDWVEVRLVHPSDVSANQKGEPAFQGVIYRTPLHDEQRRVIPGQSHFEYALFLNEEEKEHVLMLQVAADWLPFILLVMAADGFTQVLSCRRAGGSIVWYANKPGEPPATTEVESAVVNLVYQLLTYYHQQAIYDDMPLTAQQRHALDGQIIKYERYPLPSVPWGVPLEEAITWTMPGGQKLKITVREEREKQS